MQFNKVNILGSFGAYTLSNAINSAIPFFLLPILTSYLDPSAYGALTNLNTLVNLVIPFVGINIMTSIQIVYAKRIEVLPAYLSSGLVLMFVLTVFASGLLWVFSDELEVMLGVPRSIIILTASYCTYQNIVELVMAIWRMENKLLNFAVFRIGRTLLEIAITLTLIIQFDWSFEGAVAGMAYSYGAAAFFVLIILWKRGLLQRNIQFEHVSHIFKYGLPLIPHVLASTFIFYTDKLIITHYLGLSANGVYSVGFMLGQVIGLIQNSFNQAWVPFYYEQMRLGSAEVRKQIVKMTYWYFLIMLILVVVFVFCSNFIYLFLNESYQSGISVVLWISLGFAFNGMYKMVSTVFFYAERTSLLSIISSLTALFNGGLVLFLVPLYGVTGAAISTMIAFFIQFLVTWYFSTRLEDMPWRNWKFWRA